MRVPHIVCDVPPVPDRRRHGRLNVLCFIILACFGREEGEGGADGIGQGT